MEIHIWTDNTPPNALNCLQLESFFLNFFSFAIYNTECDPRFPLSLSFLEFLYSPFLLAALLSSDVFSRFCLHLFLFLVSPR